MFKKFNSFRFKIVLLFGFVSVLVGSVFIFKTVSSSSYEWISTFITPGNCCTATATGTVSWQVTTNGNWYEYRTLYYATSNGPTSTWMEFTEDEGYQCRAEGYINGLGPNDSCSITIPDLPEPAPAYLWIRATTNYSGCGTWTATPGDNCGDSISAGLPYTPHYSCSDTDGGISYYTRGTVTETDNVNSSSTQFTDVCLDINRLEEARCVNSRLYTDVVNCGVNGTTTCATGACL